MTTQIIELSGPRKQGNIPLAGVLPYIVHGQDPRSWEIMVMKPTKLRHGIDAFEIAKGKRSIREKTGGWRDLVKGEELSGIDSAAMEPLLHTALREGLEEVGLKPENITSIIDAGDYRFSSTQAQKIGAQDVPRCGPMRLYAVQVKNRNDFAAVTSPEVKEHRWMTLGEFMENGRRDHGHFAESVLQKILKASHKGALERKGMTPLQFDNGYAQRIDALPPERAKAASAATAR